MEPIPSFNSYIEQSIISNWDRDALTDYKGATLQYHDVARKIEKLHIMFENSGVQRGDKIAMCGRNSSNWGVALLATLTYGAVAVPIQHEFTPEQIYNIVNHSDAKLLFVGDIVATTIDPEQMPNLEGIIYIPDYSLVISRTEKLSYAREHLNEMFGKRYPKYFRKEHLHYYKEQSPDELAMINYTSGTTGFSKGVMLPYRAIWGNLDHILYKLKDKVKPGSNIVCTLPMAHMYGLAVEFFFGFLNGCHLFFLTRLPSPTLIAETFAQIKPAIIVSVPLVAEKIIRKKILPVVQTNRMRLLLNMPVISKKVKQGICEEVMEAFGGNLYEVVVGGAPFNQEVESFLKSIDFPLTIAYGTTETAPLIAFSDYTEYELFSCGKIVNHMEMKINSTDPENIPGELMVKGLNLMLGYYKNEEATREVIDEDGWFHTGDAGRLEGRTLYLTERIKDLFKTSNGKYVSPQALETRMIVDRYIDQIAIIADQRKFVSALIVPTYSLVEKIAREQGIVWKDRAELMSHPAIVAFYRDRIDTLQQQFAHYEQIKRFTLLPEPFSMERGELTNTLKLKRSVVARNYKEIIDRMYEE